MKNSLDEYQDLVGQYRERLSELRKAEKNGESNDLILFMDKERNEIHNKLRSIAPQIGKTSQDITLDILKSDDNLTEYGLPEFKTMRTSEAFQDPATLVRVDNKAWPKSQDNKEFEVFIPFGEQEAWRLFDSEDFIFRQPDETERRRRIQKLQDMSHGDVHLVEIRSDRTFHQATILYGAGFSVEKLNKILSLMHEHHAEISIDRKNFNGDQIREDFVATATKDLEYILQRKLDETETRLYLVNRLNDAWLADFKLDNKTEQKLRGLVMDAQERAEIADKRDEIAKETLQTEAEWNKAESAFPKTSEIGIRESLKKR